MASCVMTVTLQLPQPHMRLVQGLNCQDDGAGPVEGTQGSPDTHGGSNRQQGCSGKPVPGLAEQGFGAQPMELQVGVLSL